MVNAYFECKETKGGLNLEKRYLILALTISIYHKFILNASIVNQKEDNLITLNFQ